MDYPWTGLPEPVLLFHDCHLYCETLLAGWVPRLEKRPWPQPEDVPLAPTDFQAGYT